MGTWPLSSNSKREKEGVAYIPVKTTPPRICAPPPETWFPWLVPLIFLVDVSAFVFTMYVNNCPAHSNDCFIPSLGRYSFESPSQNFLVGPTALTLQKLGALNLKLVEDGEVWRLISCMWLHVGVLHLLANMISLLFVGVRLEKEFGFWKIGLLYLFSGFGGSLASAISVKYSNKEGASLTTSVGASGALFGLLGAMLSELFTNWTIYANKCAALSTLICVIALNMALGFLPHVDMSSHVGGFLSGYFLGFVILIRPQFGYVSPKHIPRGYNLKNVKPKYKSYQYVLWITAFVILIIG
ncbi:hypothetical protein AQUCO_00100881v1 [Aquilegia coerulea]|uniref:RHOMBOID-like protein n=1 Tax=Aquilegia coerulea TaxID=218851 RepID=A0A2G5FCD6_AQUCA|nr:hypothetical protein AQUCO_00100881v1 [Aquilegia coerulea]